ncbi:hypothetical protein FDECE_7198 [Fusarium decemcellulare]|nr:hypothetical protein FDECE_7198 [Fusarium decemcellulare]
MDLEDESFDWTLPLPPQPVNPVNLQGAGAVCETKRFDSFYNASNDRIVLPAGKKYTVRSARSYESALTVTTFWDSGQDFDRTELEIKSPHMKAALKAVVPEYHSFNIDVRHITIKGEPRSLFHYRQELLDYGAALQQQGHDTEASRHIQHLILHMWEVFAVEILAFSALEWFTDEPPSMEFKYLWMVFRPGDIVYIREPHPKAFLFADMCGSFESWELSGHCVDYDGQSFGFRKIRTTISAYDGVKPLKDLNAVHLDRLPVDEQHAVKERLVARGRKFIGIHGQQYLWYNGKSDKSSGDMVKTRIMADCEGYLAWGGSERIHLSDRKQTFKPKDAPDRMSEVDLMICNTYIAGYSLRNNAWKKFDIDSISDITFDSHAFNALILPDDQKQQILSMVRVHENDSFSFDDLVKGKGRGMIFLLYGDPGVGKTLTAESVADYFRKPLLRLDAGTLGTSAHSVEKGLKHAFNLAERWHALLLLDEADVYLEQRKSKNLVHNGIVSVFLRMLEYYHGILFLTTNRISSFDRAFISRIHLAIDYRPLSQSSRRALLYTFLKQTSENSAESMNRSGVLGRIAKEQLNGRQIKILVHTACALALSDNSADGLVNQRHMESALRPMKQFAQTMEQVFPRDKRELDQEEDEEEQQTEDHAASEAEGLSTREDEDEDGFEYDDEEEEEGEEEEDSTAYEDVVIIDEGLDLQRRKRRRLS